MTQVVFIEAQQSDAAGILCEHCETYYLGEAMRQHIADYPTHIVTWIKEELA